MLTYTEHNILGLPQLFQTPALFLEAVQTANPKKRASAWKLSRAWLLSKLRTPRRSVEGFTSLEIAQILSCSQATASRWVSEIDCLARREENIETAKIWLEETQGHALLLQIRALEMSEQIERARLAPKARAARLKHAWASLHVSFLFHNEAEARDKIVEMAVRLERFGKAQALDWACVAWSDFVNGARLVPEPIGFGLPNGFEELNNLSRI